MRAVVTVCCFNCFLFFFWSCSPFWFLAISSWAAISFVLINECCYVWSGFAHLLPTNLLCLSLIYYICLVEVSICSTGDWSAASTPSFYLSLIKANSPGH